MKYVPSDLASHIQGHSTTLAWLVRLIRQDGFVIGFTTHDRDLIVDGVRYEAASAILPTSVESTNALSVDNLDVEGILDSEAISKEDLLSGLYNGARVDVFQCNWADLTQGYIHLRRGTVGEVTIKNGQYVSEIRGMLEPLQKLTGRYYVIECDATLGDKRCRFDIESSAFDSVSTGGTIDTVTIASAPHGEGYYSGGRVEFKSGAHKNVSIEIKDDAVVGGVRTLTLWLPLATPMTAGEDIRVYPGCDKRKETCKAKFNNFLNFRGFPDIPGRDSIMTYPDATS